MAKSENQKLKLFRLLQILMTSTDDEHGIDMNEIIAALSKFGITAERKSIYNDLSLLQDEIDLVKEKVGTDTRYHVASREFDLVELYMMVEVPRK